jgi:hypothetical protein
MSPINYLIDNQGNKTAAVIAMSDFEKMLADLEELDEIRAYDAAKSSEDEEIPFEDAVADIERGW